MAFFVDTQRFVCYKNADILCEGVRARPCVVHCQEKCVDSGLIVLHYSLSGFDKL